MRAVCPVCMHHCAPLPGQTGLCLARGNVGGAVVPVNYGKITALALDPIEKKPLRRFFPGSMILSVGSFGCNLRCPFCQNYEISMAGDGETAPEPERDSPGKTARSLLLSPEDLAARAWALRDRGNIGVAFTYNEPLVGWEYVRDTARLVRDLGMKSVVVTNGSACDLVLDGILPVTDAMNIDLKGFSEAYYRKLGGDLGTVKHFISRAARCCHVELTTLIVPGENDREEEMDRLAAWVASVDPEIPLHVTRFFPRYHMADRPPTRVEAVYRLAEVAGRHLRHVYTGNC